MVTCSNNSDLLSGSYTMYHGHKGSSLSVLSLHSHKLRGSTIIMHNFQIYMYNIKNVIYSDIKSYASLYFRWKIFWFWFILV